MEWGRMGCGLSKIESNCTYIVVFDSILMKKWYILDWLDL